MNNKPRVVAVIQARMNSSRLPHKVMLPLAGAPLLQRLIERVRLSKKIDNLVVATSVEPMDDAIAELCSRIEVICHRGSETDVLGRMLDVANAQSAEALVRLTGDNPFVDGTLIDLVIDMFFSAKPAADYAHNVDESGFPLGLYVEVCRVSGLREAAKSNDPTDREHVTWFVRQRPERFRHVSVLAPGAFTERSLTIDTADDYQRLKPLFEARYAVNPTFGYRDMLATSATAH